MPEIQIPPSGASRPAYYVTAVDALYYAHYFHPVPGGRGWSKALMEENLPGWTLNDFMHLLRRHRLFVSTSFYGHAWRWPDVVGVVIEGDTLIKDEGNLEHPAKGAARRRIAVGSTGPTMRHVDGDDSPVVVHVRVSAATPDEERLHEVARAAYLASPVRPALVRNISGSLADPFDQPATVRGQYGPPVWGYLTAFVRDYNADMAALLQHMRRKHFRIVLVTLNVHDGGEPVEVFRADRMQLPEQLRTDAKGITSKVVSLRADTLLEPYRAETVAQLVNRFDRMRSAARRRSVSGAVEPSPYSCAVPDHPSSRGRLLEAAIDIVEREGEAALRVDRVAAVAGVTKPSIYHFFGDREGLIVAAQAERFRRTIAVGLIDLDRVVECDTQQEYAALIHGAVSASSSADGAERRRLRIQVLGSASTRPELRTAIDAVHRETVASLAKALGYGQRRGWFRSDFDAASLAAWWFGVVLGRHLVDEFGDATEVAEWPSITWSAVAHLMGVPSDAPHSD